LPVPEGALTGAPHELRHVHQAAREHDLGRALDLGHLAEEATVACEDLDAVTLAIAHEHVAVRIDRDPMRQHELTGPGSRLAPGREQRSRGGEAMHARVPVSI